MRYKNFVSSVLLHASLLCLSPNYIPIWKFIVLVIIINIRILWLNSRIRSNTFCVQYVLKAYSIHKLSSPSSKPLATSRALIEFEIENVLKTSLPESNKGTLEKKHPNQCKKKISSYCPRLPT